MKSAEQIKTLILDIARRPKNVSLADIEKVMNQLKQFEQVEVYGNSQSKAWSFKNASFNICTCHRGGAHLKLAHVQEFLKVMNSIGWYE
jgi:hypothetical protein